MAPLGFIQDQKGYEDGIFKVIQCQDEFGQILEDKGSTVSPKADPKSSSPASTTQPSGTICNIGSGGSVNVYLMERYSPMKGCYKSPWAVKKINSKINHGNNEYTKRLNAEAKLLKTLKHPNIIGYRSYSTSTDGTICLAMEASEKSLADLIEQRSEKDFGPFPAKTILKVCHEMCQGLNYLHNNCHLLHGDLKSANILVTGDFDQVKLCDFGVALKLDKKGNQANKKEYYIGTECWSAPEAVIGDTISHKTDMFAFGLVLWEMISLSAPHIDKLNFDDSVSEEQNEEEFQNALGQRPTLPDTDLDDSYLPVLEIFYVCTEQDPMKRPSAKQIL
ncbi:unnamed protein product, partial [Meganyctiphanes norvegica]